MLGGKAGSKIDSSATNGPLAVSEWTGHGMLQVLAMLGTVTLSVPSIFSLYLQDHGTAVSLDCSLQDSWSGFSKAIQKDVDHGSNNALATQAGLVTGTYWRKDYEQLCYQGPHLVLTWAVGVPGLLLLAAGLPMACAVWSGHTAARRGYSSRATASAVSSSLLAAEYADRCCMWESVIMLRKLAVAAASVLLVHHAGSAQVLAVMAVILAALALQTWAQPFTSSLLNWLEALSLKATLVHLYLLLLLPLCSSTAQKTAVSMLIVTVDSAALAVLLYHLAVACFVGHAKAVLSTAASLQHSSLQHGRKVEGRGFEHGAAGSTT
ncbi:predicted protein [Haematococcus lacustris]|uniref:Uncharacterized protein n=1 Tax=Haematococcus lacustris TaxID=44745 RepID=A0A699Z760_HAELA|nr:predicted protein [Haematococcus lacustris]